MGRPRLGLGTYGAIAVTGQVREDGKWRAATKGEKPERWRASTRYRDHHGKTHTVSRYESTKGKATTSVKVAIANWDDAGQDGQPITKGTTVLEAGKYWLTVIERPEHALAPRSLRSYSDSVKNHLEGSSIADLTLTEANRVGRLEAYLQTVADERGTGAAATAHRVLTGIYKEALRLEVLDVIAITNTRKPKSTKPKKVRQHLDHDRGLTPTELTELLEYVRASDYAKIHDLVDLVHVMAGTGARISEVRELVWTDVDIDAGTLHLPGTKTARSDRVVIMPDWLTERLRERKTGGRAPGTAVFPSPGRLGYSYKPDPDVPRDQSNLSGKLRKLWDDAGFPWMSAHTFRRTVVTTALEGGVPVHLVADQVGHTDPTTTLNSYASRGTGDLSVIAALLSDGRS